MYIYTLFVISLITVCPLNVKATNVLYVNNEPDKSTLCKYSIETGETEELIELLKTLLLVKSIFVGDDGSIFVSGYHNEIEFEYEQVYDTVYIEGEVYTSITELPTGYTSEGEYTFRFEPETIEIGVFAEEIMLSDSNSSTYVGTHNFDTDDITKEHPYFRTDKAEVYCVPDCFELWNQQIMEYCNDGISRLTYGYGYNVNPKYITERDIVYYTNDTEYAKLILLDSSTRAKRELEIGAPHTKSYGVPYDLWDWRFTVSKDFIFFTDRHSLYAYPYEISSDSNYDRVITGVKVNLYNTDDVIRDVAADGADNVYLLISPDESYRGEPYIVIYDIEKDEINTVKPAVTITPPITIIP